MKTYKNLYEKICDFENIYSAYLKARKNKRLRVDVLNFSCNLERNLYRIQDELLSRRYKTGSYRMFYVYEPKKRMILSLPFKDRVVQHAICNIIEPIFDKPFPKNGKIVCTCKQEIDIMGLKNQIEAQMGLKLII